MLILLSFVYQPVSAELFGEAESRGILAANHNVSESKNLY